MSNIFRGADERHSRPVVGGVLLAAGTGSRMGHRPKGLLELDGVPLIRRMLMALSGAGLAEVVVVLGEYADHLRPLVQDFPARVVCNPSPQDGQVSSQRLGLAALSPKLDAVMVTLADQPLIGTQDLSDLIGTYENRPEGKHVVVPTVSGLPGNPVIFSAQIKDAVLAGGPHLGCKQWQTAHPEAVYAWVTPNIRYRQDVDSPEDMAQLAAQTGHQLRWPPAWQSVAP